MSEIRPFETGDCDAVAAMFQKLLRRRNSGPRPGLVSSFRELFVESPACDPDIPSLVHLDGEGRVSGFIGVHVLSMTFQGTPIRAAVSGSLMASDHDSNPMVGARLLRSFTSGPQDISFSETANDVSARMWLGLRGAVLPQYSLEWVRILKPAAFGLDMAAGRLGVLRLFRPLAGGIDFCVRKFLKPDALHWAGVAGDTAAPEGLIVSETDAAGFAELVNPMTEHYALRPDWSDDHLAYRLSEATDKPDFGEPVLAVVSGRGGRPVGAFFYHARPGGIARVLQVLALPQQAGPVIDCLVSDAARRGAAALRGRTQPALLEAMLTRRIAFAQAASTVTQSRNPDLVSALRASDAFVNGLAGEQWTRLFGGRFE